MVCVILSVLAYTLSLTLNILPKNLRHSTEGGAEEQYAGSESVVKLETEIVYFDWRVFLAFEERGKPHDESEIVYHLHFLDDHR